MGDQLRVPRRRCRSIDAARLGEVPGDRVGGVALALHPSVSFLSSPWPVDQIWHANQPDADPDTTVSLDAGGAQLEIRRLGDDVVFRSLDAAPYAFRTALARGDSLEFAVAAAHSVDPELDLAQTLQQLFADGIVISIGMP